GRSSPGRRTWMRFLAESAMDPLVAEFRQLTDVQAVLDRLLEEALKLSQTGLGNVQLMNWSAGHLTIRSQKGFAHDFLKFFEQVSFDDGSVCGRALRARHAIIVEDVTAVAELPVREALFRAGISAVQSTPMISSRGAFLGVISTHFEKLHRPS